MRQSFRPGFTEGSADRIAKAIAKKSQNIGGIPEGIIRGIDALIKAAIFGQVGQIEIAVGVTPESVKKIRIVCLPDGHGTVEVDEATGKKLRVIVVPDDLGAVKVIHESNKKEEEKCAGSLVTP